MKNEKQDLTEYSDGELSLWVFNDEGLYRMRRKKDLLLETLKEIFIFTDAQLKELEADLEADEVDDE